MKRKLTLLIVLSIILPGCGKLHSAKSDTRMVMGTFANITATATSEAVAKKAVEAAFERLTAIDEMTSDYSPDSELSRVNREAFGAPVKVSNELFEVLAAAVEYSKRTDGAFDVTIGPVVELWRRVENDGAKPTEEELAAAKARVGYDKLILDDSEKTVRFAVEGMSLDLGGIAKGYAIDVAVGAMKEAGATGGLIDVGGDIRCFGVSTRKENIWRVGLEDPSGGDDLLLIVNLSDQAIATSGDYRRFVMIDDERQSHIIDPGTTASASELSSVTISAPTAMQADALATAVSVMGQKKGLELVESIEQVEAILIPAGNESKLVKTSGADKLISR